LEVHEEGAKYGNALDHMYNLHPDNTQHVNFRAKTPHPSDLDDMPWKMQEMLRLIWYNRRIELQDARGQLWNWHEYYEDQLRTY